MTNVTNVEPKNGFGLAAIILAFIGLIFGVIPLTGFIALGLGFAGLIFALANLGRLKRGKATNRKTTWAGVVLSLGAMALGIWGLTIVFGAVNEFDQDMQELDREMSQVDESFEEADAYLECVDKIELDDPEFDAKMAACE